MYAAMLETGLLYERGKHYTITTIINLHHRIEAWCDDWDAKYYQSTPCTGDILCERQGARHKAGCIGRTVPITVYMRELK